MSDSVTPQTAACQASLSITSSITYLSSCNLSRWCYPSISSSVLPFSSCLQSCPASEYFPMSLLFSTNGQSIGASASAAVLPLSIQGWFTFRLTGLVSLRLKGLSSLVWQQSLKPSFLWYSTFFMLQLLHPYMTTRKTIALTIRSWKGNRQEGQVSPNRGHRLQVSDSFSSLLSSKRKQTSVRFFPPLYTNLIFFF